MNRAARVRALFASSLLWIALGTSSARAEDAIYAPAVDAHAPGRWSLKFAIEDNFTLGSFEGSTIAATKNTSANRAWRYGISYGGDFFGASQAYSVEPDTLFPATPGSRQENTAVSLGLSVLRVHRLQPARRIGAYLELGPTVAWDHQNQQVGNDPAGGFDQDSEVNRHNLFFGATINLGAEVFVARSVSLAADYGTDLGYSTGQQSIQTTVVDTSTGTTAIQSETVIKYHRWSLRGTGVRFGVSLYL